LPARAWPSRVVVGRMTCSLLDMTTPRNRKAGRDERWSRGEVPARPGCCQASMPAAKPGPYVHGLLVVGHGCLRTSRPDRVLLNLEVAAPGYPCSEVAVSAWRCPRQEVADIRRCRSRLLVGRLAAATYLLRVVMAGWSCMGGHAPSCL
ncbi:hypothetical protein Dimus_000652, partial [Dionaea muscipula]